MSYRVLGLALLAMLLVGCGGHEAKFDFNSGIVLSRDRAEIVRDETQTVDVSLRLGRGEQFGTVVTLSASGLPAGVTATFSPATVTLEDATIHTSRMTLVADRDVPLGQFQVLVRRTAGGKDETQRLTLSTTDFAVKVDTDDNDVTLKPGEHQDIDVVLTRRGNSSGTAEMTLAGDVPDGIRWTLTPARVLIDPDHTRVHVNLRLEAADDASSNGKETCRVRALKGVNHDESDGIDVTLDVPSEG